MMRLSSNNQSIKFELKSHDLLNALIKDTLLNKENISDNLNSDVNNVKDKQAKLNCNLLESRVYSVPKLVICENFINLKQQPTEPTDILPSQRRKEKKETNQESHLLKIVESKNIDAQVNKHSSSFAQPTANSQRNFRTILGNLSKQNQNLKNQNGKIFKQNQQSIMDKFSKKDTFKNFPYNLEKDNIKTHLAKFSKASEIGFNSTRYGPKQTGNLQSKGKQIIQANKSLLDFKQELQKNKKQFANLQSQNSLNINKPLDQITVDETTKQIVSKSTSYLTMALSSENFRIKNNKPHDIVSFLQSIKEEQLQNDIIQNLEEIGSSQISYQDLESNKISKYYAFEIKCNLKKNEQKINSSFCLEKHNIPANLRAKMIDWMVEVLCSYKCCSQTFFFSVALMDAYFKQTSQFLNLLIIKLFNKSA